MKNTSHINRLLWLLILLIICFVSRAPQLVSPNLLLDGDEAIVGLMGKHFQEGREFPVFFYGQNYGLSFFEAGSAAIFFTLFGISDVSLKLSALLLWSIGVLFMYETLKNLLQSKWLPFVLTVIFILSPVWAVWSMKARGGYVTAFMFFSIYVWLVSSPTKLNRTSVWFVLGNIIAMIYFAQPLWLPAALILGVYIGLKQDKKLHKGLLTLIGFGLLFFLVRLVPSQVSWWNPKVLTGYNNESLLQLPKHLYHHLTGFYHFDAIFAAPSIVKVFVSGSILLLFAGVIILILRTRQKQYDSWASVFFISLISTLTLTLFMVKGGASPRYLLPVSGLMLFWLSRELKPLFSLLRKNKLVLSSVVVLIAFVSSYAMYSFTDYSNMPQRFERANEKEQLMRLINGIKSHGLKYATTTRGMQQWLIMFYSKEEIICRYGLTHERYPPYVKKVDDALNQGEAIAIVGFNGIFRGLQNSSGIMENTTFIDDKYFYFPYANKGTLEYLGYQFNEVLSDP